jgi:homogentisate 1,2-dioxygenase
MNFPIIRGKATKQPHVGIPEGTFEEEHGREGFFGRVSHLYHAYPPTGWTRIEGNLRPHAFDLNQIEPTDMNDVNGLPTPILYNDDVILLISRRSEPHPCYFRNADGDLLYFIHRGNGKLETDFGTLDFEAGDYIVIPRATTYRMVPETKDNFFVMLEAHDEIMPPTPEQKGLMGMHAIFDTGALTLPTFEEFKPGELNGKEYEIRVKRLGQWTSIFYPYNPIDIVGWRGDLTVYKINMRDIRPVMSHRVHLPPPVHTTFMCKNAVICSFLPRPIEEGPETLKVPFYHRNSDYDEVLFYHDGDFFSRDNIKPAMMTLHPAGIHHGPHPKAVRNQHSLTRTNEMAMMLDARNPLKIAPEAESVEWKEYWASWKEKTEAVK